MLNRALDWIDEAAGGFIRLAYLLAGVTAVGVYFGGGHLSPVVEAALNATLPWSLAAAVEVHTYLTARRVRGAWQGLQVVGAEQGDARRRALGALRVNLGILAGLLTFSALNQLQYLGATWTPPSGAFTLPPLSAYVLRAAVVPLAFMGAALMAPMGESLTAQVQAEAHRFAAATFRVARRQWRARLQEMRARNEDVTGALVQLVEDPGERHVIATIHQAMYPGVLSGGAAEIAAPAGQVFESDPEPPSSPPTGPGGRGVGSVITPSGGPRRGGHRAEVLRLTPPTVEMRVRDVLAEHPSASVGQIAKWAHVGKSAASKWRQVIMAEGPGEDGEAREA